MNTVAIVQARMGSTRFPGKVMQPICGTPMIGLLLGRLKKSAMTQRVILATSNDTSNNPLVSYVQELGFSVYRGSEKDVLDRYFRAAKEFCADTIVRITGDCPLVDPKLVDEVILKFMNSEADYASNIAPPTFPDGLDVEVFSFEALEAAWKHAKTASDREHVSSYIRESDEFSRVNVECPDDRSHERWTIDEPEDLEVVKNIFGYFLPHRDFGWLEVLELQNKHPERFMSNKHLIRNEGSQQGEGQKLWKRARQVIPGGNMLLSKRAEMHLPDFWPSYFSKAKGCKVWDLDGNEFIDMSLMGVGTNTLGYGHAEVDEAVRQIIEMGNMSTLNCPEEVILAEKLVELHPWSDMARFARSGGEANAVAVRIARAAVGKDKIAICGYHGWHDWYLSANLADDANLNGHLLPGLEAKGVPGTLFDTVYPFSYNNFAELESLVGLHDIGVIKMEVARNMEPEDNFLHKVRQLANKKNIVLIFDECTSGFRQAFGGLHKIYGVEPDMAVFGKTLGNGYAITAVIGRREIMEAAQSTFISSTFWTERIGPAAALKTLEVMDKEKSWEAITQTGEDIIAGWRRLAEKYELSITISGLPSLASFSFNSSKALEYKTLISQEMLNKGFLAGTSTYSSMAHTPEIVSCFMEELDPVFGLIKECEEGRDIGSLLKGPVCHSGFKRLN